MRSAITIDAEDAILRNDVQSLTIAQHPLARQSSDVEPSAVEFFQGDL